MSSAGSDYRSLRFVFLLVFLAMCSGAIGCTDRSRAVNAGLRDRIHELEDQNRSRDLQIQEMKLQLEAAQSPAEAPLLAGHPAIPLVTEIRIDSTSGRRQQPDDSGTRPLEIHLKAFDGRNRPIQLAGTIRVQVTLISKGEQPRELYSGELTAQDVRNAWRGGAFGGPTWMISVPIKDEDLPQGTRTLDVDIFYEDLRTGEELICGDKVDIR